jgi:hypothetical protein
MIPTNLEQTNTKTNFPPQLAMTDPGRGKIYTGQVHKIILSSIGSAKYICGV